MAIIRVADESARKLKFYGKTYDEAVKALLEKSENTSTLTTGDTDYNQIRKIVSEEIAKAAVRY